jgi:hypothetical protein
MEELGDDDEGDDDEEEESEGEEDEAYSGNPHHQKEREMLIRDRQYTIIKEIKKLYEVTLSYRRAQEHLKSQKD